MGFEDVSAKGQATERYVFDTKELLCAVTNVRDSGTFVHTGIFLR